MPEAAVLDAPVAAPVVKAPAPASESLLEIAQRTHDQLNGKEPKPKQPAAPVAKVEAPQPIPAATAADPKTRGVEASAAAAPVKSEGEASVISDDLLAMARSVGFTDDEARKIGNPLALQQAVSLVVRQSVRAAPKAPEAKAPEATAPAPLAPAAPAPVVAAAALPPDAFNMDEFKAALEGEPQLVKLAAYVKELESKAAKAAGVDELLAEVKKLKEFQESFVAGAQQSAARQEMDRVHDLLDQANPELFGLSVDPATKQPQKLADEALAKRNKVWETLQVMKEKSHREGRAIDLDALTRAAITANFLDEILNQKEADFERRVLEQSNRRMGRPTSPRMLVDAAGKKQSLLELAEELHAQFQK